MRGTRAGRASPGIPRVVALVAACAAAAGPGAAQEPEDERELGWFYTAELTFVLTAGNAGSSTLGAGAGVRDTRERAELRLRAAGLRTETSRTTRTAVGTATDFDVVERSDSEVTAESYSVHARYDRNLSSELYAFAASGWERNTFAGFDSRLSFGAGAGKTWFERETSRFKTDVGLTLTVQNDVVEQEDEAQTFAGVRAGWEYARRITETTEFESVLVVDENLDDTDDLRADFTNSLTLTISRALALRTGVQLLWDHQPSLVEIPLEATDGTPAGTTVRAPLDELDTRLTVALVASF